MWRISAFFFGFILLLAAHSLWAQSGRIKVYSESNPPTGIKDTEKESQNKITGDDDAGGVIKINTDLVVIPVQISDRSGKPVSDIKKQEFRIFENGVEQEIAYFSNDEQPFTVALVLDMSYSSIFKLADIQNAALEFINQLRPDDRVMIVSFDEKVRILCEPTGNRKVMRLAIEGARIASGTALYQAIDTVLNEKFSQVSGRKAIVLFSDGVDTMTDKSKKLTPGKIVQQIGESDALVYPIQFDTYDDVQKKRKESAQVFYDDNDRPYIVEMPKVKGEREEDYQEANEFLKAAAWQSGGKIYRVSTSINLKQAFAKIAEELRKIYSLGYYPSSERISNFKYAVNVRVYRPDLKIRAKQSYYSGANSRSSEK